MPERQGGKPEGVGGAGLLCSLSGPDQLILRKFRGLPQSGGRMTFQSGVFDHSRRSVVGWGELGKGCGLPEALLQGEG